MYFQLPFAASPLLVTILLWSTCLVGHSRADGGDFLERVEAQDGGTMRAMKMSDFMDDTQLATRANDFSQLDGRTAGTVFWGKEIESVYIHSVPQAILLLYQRSLPYHYN